MLIRNGPTETLADLHLVESGQSWRPQAWRRIMQPTYKEGILDRYPQPLAAAYTRFIDQRDPASRHAGLLALFEALLKYLAAAAAGEYLAQAGDEDEVNAALGTLRRPSLGHWAALLRLSLAWWGKQPPPAGDFPFPELPALYSRSAP